LGREIIRDFSQQHDDIHHLPLFAGAELDELAPLWDTAIPKYTQHMKAGEQGV